LDGPTINLFHNGRIVTTLERNPHGLLVKFIWIGFVQIPHVTLFAKDQEGPIDLIELKIVRRFEGLRNQLAGLFREMDGGFQRFTVREWGSILFCRMK
jgi:hypothetical protein